MTAMRRIHDADTAMRAEVKLALPDGGPTANDR